MARAKRIWAEALGRWAELWVSLYLTLKGYQILDRRVRLPACELDVVAKKGQWLCFIEVKAGRSRTQVLTRFHPHYQNRLIRAAAQWRARRGYGTDQLIRFDVCGVVHGLWICHWRAAFENDHAFNTDLI